MEVREQLLGNYPCLVVGAGPPLVVLAGLEPQAGVAPGPMRGSHEAAARLWARGRQVFYLNRRPGMAPGATMSDVAAEHADALRVGFDGRVDVLGMSTGGSIAQQLAAQHPDLIRRLVPVSTGCRLGADARSMQRRVGARVRAGALRQACALFSADLAPRGPLELVAGLGGWLLGPGIVSEDGLHDMATMIEAEDEFDLAGLPPITAPTLLVAGGRDRFYGPGLLADTAALIPDCHVEIHPGFGHVTVLWYPKAIAQVFAFLGA
jgi:pimeloyl-ACP methyl ester carboxylesterase